LYLVWLLKLPKSIFTVKESEMVKCHISNNIRKFRFHQNEMTQQELADKTGVTRQTIVAIEQGKYSPSLELAFRIARVFNSPLEEVFSYISEKNSY
jgi:putative transcriptional regulator